MLQIALLLYSQLEYNVNDIVNSGGVLVFIRNFGLIWNKDVTWFNKLVVLKELSRVLYKKERIVMSEKTKKPIYKKWWVWLIVVVVLIGIGEWGEESETVDEKKR